MSHECIPPGTDLYEMEDFEKKIGPRHMQNVALNTNNINSIIYGILTYAAGGCRPNPSEPVIFFLFKQRNSSLCLSLGLHQPVKCERVKLENVLLFDQISINLKLIENTRHEKSRAKIRQISFIVRGTGEQQC